MKNICDWNNCTEEGLFKAPKERDNSKDYRLLCLNHVKEFNKSWNYLLCLKNLSNYGFKIIIKYNTFIKLLFFV